MALINVIFKLVAKAYASRLSPVAHRIISPSQTAFIKGCLIHDGASALHELKTKNLSAVILKLDFEKAYVGLAGLPERGSYQEGLCFRLCP